MGEYIDREQIKKAIHCSGDDLLFIGGKTYIDFEIVKKAALDTTTADVAEVKHGHWIEIDIPCHSPDDPDIGYECSLCENYSNFKHPYCPTCGAKMYGKERK